ncbi:protogloblin ApPgb [Siphonobacter sp. BAB-5405]|uniref:protoglobin domain-containing protein n=1 Tax=Siphonobacter sp. BAB-5405 TaxID=1864825 RepID=UPI000C7FA4FE|nr:protoglobin domain-containing protein [Siphonobacter sp. BAB-5405]PMD92363.1 protogloblin ApPgb [Siphonobacter sp. BAB-5405]
MSESHAIPGYTYGDVSQTTPLSLEELDLLKQTVLFSPEDERFLQLAGDVLGDQTEAILDVWYGYVGSHPHLLHYFSLQGQPDAHYLSAVRKRFGQWIIDTCTRPYDTAWLAYQQEIALRHHTAKKNRTDEARAEPIIHLRYILAFIVPLTLTIKEFLAAKGHDAETVAGMHAAWFKAVTLTAVLWSYPYVHTNEF